MYVSADIKVDNHCPESELHHSDTWLSRQAIVVPFRGLCCEESYSGTLMTCINMARYKRQLMQQQSETEQHPSTRNLLRRLTCTGNGSGRSEANTKVRAHSLSHTTRRCPSLLAAFLSKLLEDGIMFLSNTSPSTIGPTRPGMSLGARLIEYLLLVELPRRRSY